MDTLHEPFIAAINASPDDDLPRLVYADYLDESGDPVRAEFIRVQCLNKRWPKAFNCPDCGQPYLRIHPELGDISCPDGHRWNHLKHAPSIVRESDLFRFHSESLFGHEKDEIGLRPILGNEQVCRVSTVTVSRGFPEVLTCDVASWFGHWSLEGPKAVVWIKKFPTLRTINLRTVEGGSIIQPCVVTGRSGVPVMRDHIEPDSGVKYGWQNLRPFLPFGFWNWMYPSGTVVHGTSVEARRHLTANLISYTKAWSAEVGE